jgi:histidyl-tRNA synthetase
MDIPQSFHEIMPDDVWKWKYLECQIEQVLSLFNYQEIRLSVLQDYETLQKGITALLDTDEVHEITSQVINLDQPDGNIGLLSLRPEGTINVLNHVASRFQDGKIHRIFYHGPMFRKDANQNPMEFYQLGVELLGSDSILSENEIISMGMKLCQQLGLKDIWLDINSFGCEADRPVYYNAMREFLKEHKDEYCEACLETLNNNPLHATECLDKDCLHSTQQGPKIQDYLCKKCKINFTKVKKIQANLANEYKINDNLFKNFSYYNETVFNFMINKNSEALLIGGGGRYDFLSNRITGKQIPAVGFYFNLDTIFKVMSERGLFQTPKPPFRVYICTQSEDLEIMLLQIVQELHQDNISTVISADIQDNVTEMQNAIKNECEAMIILRNDNIREGKTLLKNLVKDSQSYVALSDLLPEIDLIRKSVQ